MTRKKKPSRLTKALLGTADDMRRVGILDSASHEKITLRHLGGKADIVGKRISGDEIRSLRERAFKSGRLRPISQPHGRLCLATGARRQAADRSGAGAAKCHSSQGYRGHLVKRNPP